MIPSFEQRHSLGGRACPMGGGGGSSQSSQSTNATNTSIDKRAVLDNGSVMYAPDNGSTLNLTSYTTNNTSDYGAINAAGQIALSGLNTAGQTTNNAINQVAGVTGTALTTNNANIDHLLTTADHLFTQQQNSLQVASDLTRSLAGTAATAYADASNTASGNKQLILAAMAVVGVVAFSSLRK